MFEVLLVWKCLHRARPTQATRGASSVKLRKRRAVPVVSRIRFLGNDGRKGGGCERPVERGTRPPLRGRIAGAL